MEVTVSHECHGCLCCRDTSCKKHTCYVCLRDTREGKIYSFGGCHWCPGCRMFHTTPVDRERLREYQNAYGKQLQAMRAGTYKWKTESNEHRA